MTLSDPAAVMARLAEIENQLAERIDVQHCGLETPCWLWNRSRITAGYGDFWSEGIHVYAHRWAYEALHGELPGYPMQLDHLCSNPPCCNPLHLEAVTPTQNIRRSRKAKLSVEDVAHILSSTESYRALARRFNVTHQTVAYYKSGNYERRRAQWTQS